MTVRPADLPGGPFDVVLDVGGNVGEFAEACVTAWPGCLVVSFEPMPWAARMSRARAVAGGPARWRVVESAVSVAPRELTLHVCVNQPTASTVETPGPARADRFGIVDVWEDVRVRADRLDTLVGGQGLLLDLSGRTLLKVDVEGHELEVLLGAGQVLRDVDAVVAEVNVAPVFEGQPSAGVIDRVCREHGLFFAGVVDALLDPESRLVQFDGVWARGLTHSA